MPQDINIIRRRQSGRGDEVILVDRGPSGDSRTPRYVTGRANAHSLSHGEWYWGHYFHSFDEAMEDFNAR